MTTAVTVKHANAPVYVYAATLNDDLDGDYVLCGTVEEGEQTFYVHSTQDIMITENKLDE